MLLKLYPKLRIITSFVSIIGALVIVLPSVFYNGELPIWGTVAAVIWIFMCTFFATMLAAKRQEALLEQYNNCHIQSFLADLEQLHRCRATAVYLDINRAAAYYSLGDFTKARHLMDDIKDRVKGPYRLTWFHNMALLAMREGNTEEAETNLSQLKSLLGEKLPKSQCERWDRMYHSACTSLHITKGELDGAEAFVQQALSAAESPLQKASYHHMLLRIYEQQQREEDCQTQRTYLRTHGGDSFYANV